MLTENYGNVLLVLFLFFIVFGLAELLYQKHVAQYITRKIVHIGGGCITALLPLFLKLETVIALGIVFYALLLFSKRKRLLNSIHKMTGNSSGALIFAPSLTLTALIFWPINTLIFQGAALILGLSDGIAGIVGKKYGKRKYKITAIKTVEGSLIFFVVTFFVLSGVSFTNGGLALDKIVVLLISAAILTVVESLFGDGWDNLFIPLTSGVILYFIL